MRRVIFATIMLLSLCSFLIFYSGISQGTQKRDKAAADSKGPVTWVKTFGGPALEFGYSMQHTSDGGCVAIGYSFASDKQDPDLWVVRLNARGDKVWEKTFERAVHDGSENYAVCQAADGNIFVLAPKNIGEGYSFFGVVRVMKLDDTGKIIWEKGFSQGGAVGHAILATTEGGCLVGGYRFAKSSASQVGWVIKLDNKGDTVWEKLLESAGAAEKSTALLKTSDNHYLIAYTAAESGKGLRIAKLDMGGNVIWSKTYHSTYGSRNRDIVKSLILTPDGEIIVAGRTGETGFNGFILKLDANGEWQWDRLIRNSDGGGYAQPTGDGGCLVVFRQDNYSERRVDLLVVKFDKTGKEVWARVIGEPGRSYLGFALDGASDGGFIVAGYKSLTITNSDLFVMKMDESGRIGKPGLSIAAPASLTIMENIFKQKLEYLRTDKPEVTVLMVEIPAGGDTGWHYHPVPVYAYVLSGSITVEIDNGDTYGFREGDVVLMSEEEPNEEKYARERDYSRKGNRQRHQVTHLRSEMCLRKKAASESLNPSAASIFTGWPASKSTISSSGMWASA